MSSLALGLYFNPIRLARSDSSMLLKCAHNNPVSLGGAALTCSLISVMKASVPSDPAMSEQKLKSGPPAVKGAISTSRSTA